jgi:predicted nuclease of predicted toxin-antitoxin system
MLIGLGHDAHTVHDEGIGGRDDGVVWSAAQAERRFVLTQDLGFALRAMKHVGAHAGLLVIRLHHPSRRSLVDRLDWVFAHESIAEWPGSIVSVTDHKVRVRRMKR